MTTLAARRHDASAARSLRTGLLLSGLAHVAFVSVLVSLGMGHDAPRPPIYRVELVGAPKGERQAGVVAPTATDAVKKADAPAGAERAPVEKAMPSKKAAVAPPKATPSPVRSKAAGTKALRPPLRPRRSPRQAAAATEARAPMSRTCVRKGSPSRTLGT